MFNHLNITVYVTGSVAVYKSLILIRKLMKKGANVSVIMTSDAQRFITKLTFQTLSKNNVIVDDDLLTSNSDITHVKVADQSDLVIVVPATANFIAKIANGIADDISTTTFLATHCQKVIVPAMNVNMLKNPATQRNLHQLKLDGMHVLQTNHGMLAEGYIGDGRMLEPDQIIDRLEDLNLKNDHILNGKKVVVTAGGTIEPLDPVRYITNRSSGKMGYAIAKNALKHGAKVSLITAPTNLNRPSGMKVIEVNTSEEMEQQVLDEFHSADILIMAAAVADFKPVHFNDQKIKKHGGQLSIEFQMTNDILKDVSKIKKNHQIVVGFAAETNHLLQNAHQKLKSKKVDILVANDVSNHQIGFNSDNNQVTFLRMGKSPLTTKVKSKEKIAEALIQMISQLNVK